VGLLPNFRIHLTSILLQVQEHDRKERRLIKKNPSKYGKKMTKDPGIPNLYPFKAQLLERVSCVFGGYANCAPLSLLCSLNVQSKP
jgi:hypothetical protein